MKQSTTAKQSGERVAEAHSRAPARRGLQARSTATRETLLAVAREVFAEKGYMATDLAEVVNRAPVTKGALYHHFASKEKLFEQACIRIAEELHETASDVVRGYSGDAWKQLTVSTVARFDLIVASPEAQQILLIDGPSVLGWKRWRDLQADVSLQPLKKTFDILIEQGVIAEQPTGPIAQLVLAALNEAALSVAGSEDAKSESLKLLQALFGLINGLRLNPIDQ